jgi:ABC-2 type transport system ATP-binding protein
MPDPVIRVEQLSKTYVVPVRGSGLAAAFKSLVRRQTRAVEAVRQVSFTVEPGEIVGFLGPNGAGKTTTLKMLSGLLHPTAGEARVLGYVPHRRERAYLRQITLVMGQRNQLIWDIPVMDSFERNRAIYRIPEPTFTRTVTELRELLDLQTLLDKPVRNLSPASG